MINNREIYQIQKDIEQLKSKTFITNWGELKEGILTINRNDIIPPNTNYNAEEPISILVFKQPHEVKKSFSTLAEIREDGFFYSKFSFNENPEKEFDFNANYHGSFVAMTTPIGQVEFVYTEDEALKNQCIEKNIEVGAIISSARAVDDSEVIKVNQVRGIDKLVTKYAGDPGQLVVNTETKRLHIMDGETNGGTIVPNMQDLSNVEVDLTNYYNKAEVDEKVDGIDLTDYYNKTEVDEEIGKRGFNTDWGNLDVYNEEESLVEIGTNSYDSYESSCVEHNGKIYFITSSSSDKSGPIGVFDINTKTTSLITGKYSPSIGAGLCICDNKLIVAGGESGNYNLSCSAGVSCYDLVAKEWTTLPSLPSERYNIGLAASGKTIYMCGGRYYSTSTGGSNRSGLYKLTLGDSEWTKVEGIEPSGHSFMAVKDSILYVYSSDFKSYNLLTGEIKTLTKSSVAPLMNCCCIFGNKFFGLSSIKDANENMKVSVMDLETMTWDTSSVKYPNELSYLSRACCSSNAIYTLHYSKIHEFTPIGTIFNTKVEVSNIKGKTKDINRYSGVPGQLVVNKETNRLHLMDGINNGGTVIPNMNDVNIPEVDLTNYYTKQEIDEILSTINGKIEGVYDKEEMDKILQDMADNIGGGTQPPLPPIPPSDMILKEFSSLKNYLKVDYTVRGNIDNMNIYGGTVLKYLDYARTKTLRIEGRKTYGSGCYSKVLRPNRRYKCTFNVKVTEGTKSRFYLSHNGSSTIDLNYKVGEQTVYFFNTEEREASLYYQDDYGGACGLTLIEDTVYTEVDDNNEPVLTRDTLTSVGDVNMVLEPVLNNLLYDKTYTDSATFDAKNNSFTNSSKGNFLIGKMNLVTGTTYTLYLNASKNANNEISAEIVSNGSNVSTMTNNALTGDGDIKATFTVSKSCEANIKINCNLSTSLSIKDAIIVEGIHEEELASMKVKLKSRDPRATIDYIKDDYSIILPSEFDGKLKAVGDVKDEFIFKNGLFKKCIGTRAYTDGDENNSAVYTDKTNTYYVLESPELIIGTSLPIKVYNFGTKITVLGEIQGEFKANLPCNKNEVVNELFKQNDEIRNKQNKIIDIFLKITETAIIPETDELLLNSMRNELLDIK